MIKADKEKGELAARVAQLEARLKDRDAEAAAKPAPSPKVMHTFCFSKFNLQKKIVTLSLADTKIGWSQFGKIKDSRSFAR